MLQDLKPCNIAVSEDNDLKVVIAVDLRVTW